MSTNMVYMDYAIAQSPNISSINGWPIGMKHIPENIFLDAKAKTFVVPEWIDSMYYHSFPSGARLILEGKTATNIYNKVNWNGILLYDKEGKSDPSTWGPSPYNPSSFYCGNKNHPKSIVVPGALYGYTFVSESKWNLNETGMRITKYEPWLTAKMILPNGGITIHLGDFDLYQDAPFIVEWGDGNVEYFIGEYPTAHTYAEAGEYTVRITTEAKAIYGYNDGPFLSVEDTDANPYWTEFHFSDSLGIRDFGATTFKNCGNLILIKCEATKRDAYFSMDADGNKSAVGNAPVKILHDSAFRGEDLKGIPNYPWGYAGDRKNIVGIDGVDSLVADYTKYELKDVPSGTAVNLHVYVPRRNGIITINWGDGTLQEVGWSQVIEENNGEWAQHTYGSGGDYTIVISGDTDGIDIEGDGTVPNIYINQAQQTLVATGDMEVFYLNDWAAVDKWARENPGVWYKAYNNSYQYFVPGWIHMTPAEHKAHPPELRHNVKVYKFASPDSYWATNTQYTICNPYLKSVEFGRNIAVTNIGKRAFYNCKALTSINLTTLNQIEEVGDEAFAGTIIKDFGELSASLKKVGRKAFYSVPKLALKGNTYDYAYKKITFLTPVTQLEIANNAMGAIVPFDVEWFEFKFNGSIGEIRNNPGFPFIIPDQEDYITEADRQGLVGYLPSTIRPGDLWDYSDAYRISDMGAHQKFWMPYRNFSYKLIPLCYNYPDRWIHN